MTDEVYSVEDGGYIQKVETARARWLQSLW